MYIFATFEYSNNLELILLELEKNEVDRTNILVLPLDQRVGKTVLFDTLHQSDGKSLFDLTASFGVVFMLLGAIYGFIWEWGPIIWGLIGLLSGALLGTGVAILFKKKDEKALTSKIKHGEVIMMIHCTSSQKKKIEEILWDNYAIGVAQHYTDTNTKQKGLST
jgi:hypothetical protein